MLYNYVTRCTQKPVIKLFLCYSNVIFIKRRYIFISVNRTLQISFIIFLFIANATVITIFAHLREFQNHVVVNFGRDIQNTCSSILLKLIIKINLEKLGLILF